MDEGALQPLPWLPVLETGYEHIDRQHRQLISDANDVQTIVARRSDWTALTVAIGKMHQDCATHFAEENRLLQSANFSDVKAHELEHQRILTEVAKIHGIVRAASMPTPYHWELALSLRGLLIDHFLRYDLQYKSHLMYYERPIP